MVYCVYFLLFAYNCRFIATLGSYMLSWGSIDFSLYLSLASQTSLFPQLLFFRLFFTPSNDRFFFCRLSVQSTERDAVSILLDLAGSISSSTSLLASKLNKSIIQFDGKRKRKKIAWKLLAIAMGRGSVLSHRNASAFADWLQHPGRIVTSPDKSSSTIEIINSIQCSRPNTTLDTSTAFVSGNMY